MKLGLMLDQILSGIEKDPWYNSLNEIAKDIYFNNILLIEFYNDDNAYPYKKTGNHFTFIDKDRTEYVVSYIYIPLGKPSPYFEFKVGYLVDGTPRFNLKDISSSDPGRIATIGKIYKDECIPKFTHQDICPDLKFLPYFEDTQRYNYALRMVKHFPIPNTELIEDKPHSITIRLKDFTPRKEPDAGDFID